MAALHTAERLQRSKLFWLEAASIVVSDIAATGASTMNDLHGMSGLRAHGFFSHWSKCPIVNNGC